MAINVIQETSTIVALLHVIEARLNGCPRDAVAWRTIVIQLRRATRLAEAVRDEAQDDTDTQEEAPFCPECGATESPLGTSHTRTCSQFGKAVG